MQQQCLIDLRRYTGICVATVVTFVCGLIGTDTPVFKFLLELMVADYITGLMVAGCFKKSKKTKSGALSSSVAFEGVKHKALMLLNIAIAVHLEKLIQVEYTADLLIGYYVGVEVISILENGGLMGVPYPKKLRKALDVLIGEEDEK